MYFNCTFGQFSFILVALKIHVLKHLPLFLLENRIVPPPQSCLFVCISSAVEKKCFTFQPPREPCYKYKITKYAWIHPLAILCYLLVGYQLSNVVWSWALHTISFAIAFQFGKQVFTFQYKMWTGFVMT